MLLHFVLRNDLLGFRFRLGFGRLVFLLGFKRQQALTGTVEDSLLASRTVDEVMKQLAKLLVLGSKFLVAARSCSINA